MKIALGTVQFGLDYGVANKKGRPSSNEISQIIDMAKFYGIDTLDTAAAYGSTESILGAIGVNDFKVISKLPPSEPGKQIIGQDIVCNIDRSLEKLKVPTLYGCLFHRPLELLNKDGEKLYKILSDLKKQGLINKIGVSVYSPNDLDLLESNFDFDLVQAPMSIIDRRMWNSGWLEKLNRKGVEIHIRSVFLQGLLLMPKNERPTFFKPWTDIFEQFDNWLYESGYSRLEAAIGFLNSVAEVDKILVGVDSLAQLSEIMAISQNKVCNVPDSLQSNDVNLLNPGLWKI